MSFSGLLSYGHERPSGDGTPTPNLNETLTNIRLIDHGGSFRKVKTCRNRNKKIHTQVRDPTPEPETIHISHFCSLLPSGNLHCKQRLPSIQMWVSFPERLSSSFPVTENSSKNRASDPFKHNFLGNSKRKQKQLQKLWPRETESGQPPLPSLSTA